MVMHACNPSTWEAVAGGTIMNPWHSGIHRALGQHELHSKILSKKKAIQTTQKLGIQKVRIVKILVKGHIIRSRRKI